MYSFSYAGINLSDLKTINWTQTPEYTEDGMNYLYTRFDITVQAILNGDLPPAQVNQAPAFTLLEIRSCLTKPRQALLVTDIWNGQEWTVLQSPAVDQPGGAAPGATCSKDAKNGPIPGPLRIIQMSPQTYIIEYSITTWLYECCLGGNDGGDSPQTGIISHRWTENVSIDQNFFTTYTRRGRLIFRGDKLTTTCCKVESIIGIDQFRGVITAACPLKQGFLRTKSDYTMQSDGLAIDYVIEDKEQYVMPLMPETKFEGEYRITTQLGAKYEEEVVVRAEAPKSVAKKDLINAALTTMLFRLTRGDPVNNSKGRSIKDGYIVEYLHENRVECRLRVQNVAALQLKKGFPIPGSYVNAYGAENEIPDPGQRGTAGLYLAAAQLCDPCLVAVLPDPPADREDNDPTPSDTGQVGNPLTQPGIVQPPTAPVLDFVTGVSQPSPLGATITIVQNLQADSYTGYQPDELSKGIYTDYEADISYVEDLHILQLPVAGGTQCSFAILASPTMMKIVNWTAEKLNEEPSRPNYLSSDPNEVLLNWKIITKSQEYDTDGSTIIYRISGVYTYGIQDPTQVTMAYGTVPYTTLDYNETAVDNDYFVEGLTSPDGSPQTFDQINNLR